jgi:hypothetical protein
MEFVDRIKQSLNEKINFIIRKNNNDKIKFEEESILRCRFEIDGITVCVSLTLDRIKHLMGDDDKWFLRLRFYSDFTLEDSEGEIAFSVYENYNFYFIDNKKVYRRINEIDEILDIILKVKENYTYDTSISCFVPKDLTRYTYEELEYINQRKMDFNMNKYLNIEMKTCSICLTDCMLEEEKGIFSNGLLPCGHFLCLKCHYEMNKRNQNKKCPCCRKKNMIGSLLLTNEHDDGDLDEDEDEE